MADTRISEQGLVGTLCGGRLSCLTFPVPSQYQKRKTLSEPLEKMMSNGHLGQPALEVLY
jgi:hypothetical protein